MANAFIGGCHGHHSSLQQLHSSFTAQGKALPTCSTCQLRISIASNSNETKVVLATLRVFIENAIGESSVNSRKFVDAPESSAYASRVRLCSGTPNGGNQHAIPKRSPVIRIHTQCTENNGLTEAKNIHMNPVLHVVSPAWVYHRGLAPELVSSCPRRSTTSSALSPHEQCKTHCKHKRLLILSNNHQARKATPPTMRLLNRPS